MLGHAPYLAPEQISLNSTTDGRTDLYATGILLYVMLTARLPFSSKGGKVLLDVAKAVPPPPSTWRGELPKADNAFAFPARFEMLSYSLRCGGTH